MIIVGSFCPSPIPRSSPLSPLPSPLSAGQPCTTPGALDCTYDVDVDDAHHCCCGRCPKTFTISCVPDENSTTGGSWQLPVCPQLCHPCNDPAAPHCEGEWGNQSHFGRLIQS